MHLFWLVGGMNTRGARMTDDCRARKNPNLADANAQPNKQLHSLETGYISWLHWMHCTSSAIYGMRLLATTVRRTLLQRRIVLSGSGAIRHGSAIPPRSSQYAVPTKSHVESLRSLLSGSSAVQSTLDGSATAGDLVGYNDDWMNKYHGKSPIVVKPRNTEEVSKVVKYCHENDIAIVPQAGNTGLVGKPTFLYAR